MTVSRVERRPSSSACRRSSCLDSPPSGTSTSGHASTGVTAGGSDGRHIAESGTRARPRAAPAGPPFETMQLSCHHERCHQLLGGPPRATSGAQVPLCARPDMSFGVFPVSRRGLPFLDLFERHRAVVDLVVVAFSGGESSGEACPRIGDEIVDVDGDCQPFGSVCQEHP